jgi:hypothetical protein
MTTAQTPFGKETEHPTQAQIRNGKVPRPIQLDKLLKQDQWKAEDALLLLAGFSLGTQFNKPVPNFIAYLDGAFESDLDKLGLRHPIHQQALNAFNELTDYWTTSLEDMKTPTQWIEWAIQKGCPPYWLEYANLYSPKPIGDWKPIAEKLALELIKAGHRNQDSVVGKVYAQIPSYGITQSTIKRHLSANQWWTKNKNAK